ncbi:electron transfer flavoprotein beta subunit lysine methyltransferase [Papilio machaon]|uniref:electron transfer flavoprotein beta subunit lysine methyltransferase n=1 Tax=Papilio machaon TaxID=76193 RepID=UPI001E6636CB|nr:electron transfer flavoprotein beta subunit lysine methyltransferase [Papilio machaon]
MRNQLVSQIIKHTIVSRAHLTPEMALRLLTPQCSLWSAPPEENPFKDPYWAFYWPGGQASARYILDNKHLVKGRVVVDVGCGCGASAIAAAMGNARRAVANDIDPVAIVASQLNAQLNGVAIDTSSEDLVGTDCSCDLVVVGDMLYDEEFADRLFSWLTSLARDGKLVLIGDPGRHGLTGERRSQLSLMRSYPLPKNICEENHGYTDANVWRLKAD